MRISIWDVLTGITLLGIICLVGAFGMILLNPNVGFNPLPPQGGGAQQQTIPTIVLPTVTPTSLGLPATWTPAPDLRETQLAGAASTLYPTSTPVPTFTVVVLPTFTPSRAAPVAHGGGNCSVTAQTPPDGTYETAGKSFDVQWTIKNQSPEMWRSDSIDIRWMGGDKLGITQSLYDMPYDVSPSAMLTIPVKMIAPLVGGAYTSNWALVKGSTTICQFYLQIKVQ